MLFTLCVATSWCGSLGARTPDDPYRRYVYAGVGGGIPVAMATFSSVGHDCGWPGLAGAVYGGFRFSPLIAAEMSLGVGHTVMSAQNCCVASGYWLGQDGHTYLAAVAGMSGLHYEAIKSSVTLQRYGAGVNVNILALSEHTRYCPWTVDVTPSVALIGSTAHIKSQTGNRPARLTGTRWHLGYGAGLQVQRSINTRLKAGVYSQATWLTGAHMDMIPVHVHHTNMIWETGVKISMTVHTLKHNSTH